MVDASTRDDSLYPPRCCSKPFSYEALVQIITPELRSVYDVKRVELEVPATNRIFCPNPTCSSFLGSIENADKNINCEKCGTSVCPLCRQASHAGEICSENAAIMEVRELARREHWQTCPGCKAVIELYQGCYHITCRCRAQFCYLCAVPWKNCTCPHWNEDRLLDTARLRVQQEIGFNAPVAEPVIRERVRRMVNVLRETHNCVGHRWYRRGGSAACEECQDTLPNFILVWLVPGLVNVWTNSVSRFVETVIWWHVCAVPGIAYRLKDS